MAYWVASGLGQPEGPAFDHDGQLFLVEMDESRQAITRIENGKRAELARVAGRPTGLAFDGDNCLWVTGGPGGSLVRLAPDGRELLRVSGDPTGDFLFPNDLAFSPDGLLYMTDSGMRPDEFISGLNIRPDFFTAPYAGAIIEIDPRRGRVLRRIDTGLRFANGIAFGPDGALYAAESLTGWIYRYDLGAAAAREPFSQTIDLVDASRFNGPDGMAFDESGYLYCAIYGRGEITVSAPNGHIGERISTNGRLPTNLAFIPGRAEIAVTEVEHGAVERIAVARRGAPLHRF